MKELKVDAIKCGTVIDHIPKGKVFRIVELLSIGEDDQVMIGTNLSSSKFGKKDVIKIEDRILSLDELNSIALIAPQASISIIDNFKAKSKQSIKLPDIIHDIIECPNHHCVTQDDGVSSSFVVESREPLRLRCHYCERVFEKELNKYISL